MQRVVNPHRLYLCYACREARLSVYCFSGLFLYCVRSWLLTSFFDLLLLRMCVSDTSRSLVFLESLLLNVPFSEVCVLFCFSSSRIIIYEVITLA